MAHPIRGGHRRTIHRVPDEVTLPPLPASVGQARRFVVERLARLGVSDPDDDAALVVSELVTNAVLHARTDLVVRVRRYRRGVARVEVVDGSSVLPGPRAVTRASRSGRGLTLVDELASDWGVEPSGTGKVVWFMVGAHRGA